MGVSLEPHRVDPAQSSFSGPSLSKTRHFAPFILIGARTHATHSESGLDNQLPETRYRGTIAHNP